MSREIVSGFLNSIPAFLEQPCVVWSGEVIPRFIRDIHKGRAEFLMFVPEGGTIPPFLDTRDESVTEHRLPNDGGSVFVKTHG